MLLIWQYLKRCFSGVGVGVWGGMIKSGGFHSINVCSRGHAGKRGQWLIEHGVGGLVVHCEPQRIE